MRAADAGDGSAMLEVGYCYQHGYGVRSDLTAAARWYEVAIRSSGISQLEREEAMYLLAMILLLRNPNRASRSRALRLLKRANADEDYPQAAEVSQRVQSRQTLSFCTCRRGLHPRLARLRCPQHAGRAA
jgi:TPR repeat protein